MYKNQAQARATGRVANHSIIESMAGSDKRPVIRTSLGMPIDYASNNSKLDQTTYLNNVFSPHNFLINQTQPLDFSKLNGRGKGY